MSHTDYDDENISCRPILLSGHDNFKDWERDITNRLVGRDLYEIAAGIESYSSLEQDQANWRKKDIKAWAFINSSLEATVHDLLPPDNISIQSLSKSTLSQAYSLFSHLRETYSVIRGTQLAELYYVMWKTNIEEASDPMGPIEEMKKAFNHLRASQKPVSDVQLAYAILIALPPSYISLAQTFFFQNTPSSVDVISSISNEWRRRTSLQGSRVALTSRTQHKDTTRKCNQRLSTSRNIPGKTPYCDFHRTTTHWSRDCKAKRHMDE
ncbi:uncharacterized protein L203_105998 [Cryptococcus depauperatus CBS 7841]|uniref:Uncharacterized protein n=1 Tax=Cryptococcus depauperatus CBS 7841 TaxID=1295531 RepID=A0A1E3IV40_9TREE|nr:hypothetical protein L203_00705 [Cryptococcus depauperatus CBS 7841]